jgi:hypothetical protein
LEAREKEVFGLCRDGGGTFSDLEVKAFYRGFHDRFAAWRRIASDKMWESFRGVQNDQTQAWKLLKRIRGTSRAVPIEPGKLLEHFRNIFFNPDRPLSIQYPALHHRPVFGPFLADDYNLSANFSMIELQTALDNLNQAAGVGPSRISAKWLIWIFSTPTSKQFLLLLFNQCFSWGVCPAEWSESEFFVLYKDKGDVTDTNNYRAINLLDDFYCLYSRLLYKRLAEWADRYN